MEYKISDIAYTAGFFEGEGGMYIGFGGKRYQIRIVNTNKKIIDYLHNLWGGIIYERNPIKNKKQAYDLIISSEKEVINFITSIRPFFIGRNDEINDKIDLGRKLKIDWLC